MNTQILPITNVKDNFKSNTLWIIILINLKHFMEYYYYHPNKSIIKTDLFSSELYLPLIIIFISNHLYFNIRLKMLRNVFNLIQLIHIIKALRLMDIIYLKLIRCIIIGTLKLKLTLVSKGGI